MESVPVFCGASAETFRRDVEPLRRPAVLRGLDVGPCVERWRDPEYLASRVPEGAEARVHVTAEPNMDFRAKNFRYRTMPLASVFRQSRNDDADELLYLREVGRGGDARGDARGQRVARLDDDFPLLAEDFRLPDLFNADRLFSSVLRVSSARVRVWTHYDVMDNVYVQAVGRKRAVLWAPDQALRLYLDGDKSRVVDIDRADADRFPLFAAAARWEAELLPGDALFIPAMWFHNMTAVDAGVAVNVFWKNLDERLYDPKDVYGNADLVPAAKAVRMLDNVVKQLDQLPEDMRDFYGRRLMATIERKCLKHQ